ncbi:MAG: glycosyltransferase involved in cell wall biosynthesis [Saprospiraceae bacterium]
MKANLIKVVHLIPRDGIGGVEIAAQSMVRASKLECNYKLVSIAGDNSVRNSDRVSVSPFHSENNPLAHLHTIKQVISIKPDVLVCSLWRSVPVGLGVKIIRPSTKLVFFLHSTVTAHFLDWFSSKLVLLFCDAVWADSVATISSRVGSRKGLVKRVISFVTHEIPVELIPNKRAPRFVFWGRLHRDKGLDRAINFIYMLVERGCHASYEIWGPDDGELNSIEVQIESLGLKNMISLKGPANHNDLNQIVEGNCFYLQFSRNEGMAMSVVEAMQRSLVPIVTGVGEISTYCRQGHNAIVVKDPDNPIEAVDDVISILNDEAMYRQLQAAAHNHWAEHVLYKDDVCVAANELCK